jgi:hypothetical protein
MADDPKNNVDPYDDDNPDVDNPKRISDNPVWRSKSAPSDDDERDPNTPRLADHPNYKQHISVAPITALKDKLRAAPSPGDIIRIMSDDHATMMVACHFSRRPNQVCHAGSLPRSFLTITLEVKRMCGCAPSLARSHSVSNCTDFAHR